MAALYHNQTINLPMKSRGFTLIEMILVIVILGVLAIGTTTFIKYGMQIYGNATDREDLIGSARFAIERLNREVRSAVPNSIQVKSGGDGKCLEFTPIALSTVYTYIPIAPESSSTIKVIAFDTSLLVDDLKVGVYLTQASEFYDDSSEKIYSLNDNNIENNDGDDEWSLTLDASVTFEQESPTNRIYFFNNSTSYCIDDEQLFRIHDGNKVIMAEDIAAGSDFYVDNATLKRNSIVSMRLNFNKNNELIEFNHNIQVPNVP